MAPTCQPGGSGVDIFPSAPRSQTLFSLAVAQISLFSGTMTMSREEAPPALERATFGGGCFWCVEAVFERLAGVKSVTSGYAGGELEHPDYQRVCSGATGHAEVVQIEFDPAVISFERLLEVFWAAHDPTTLNRQGADEGTQYRSIILWHDELQRAAAVKSRATAQEHFSSALVTEIVPLKKFWPAEDYHQDFFRNNPRQPYCLASIPPKLKKLGLL
jgi:peptide-methionine (S)-S-oxide reductase